MRRLVLLPCLVALLVVSAAGPAAAALGGRHIAQVDTQQFTLWAREAFSIVLAPDGTVIEDPDEEFFPEPGTRFFVIDTLYADDERTDEVGDNRIECLVLRAEGENEEDFAADIVCQGVVTLDGRGDISWQTGLRLTPEPDPDEPFATVALTGGTMEFVGAGGEVDLFDETPEDAPEEPLTRYEVTLLLPELAD